MLLLLVVVVVVAAVVVGFVGLRIVVVVDGFDSVSLSLIRHCY